MILCWGSGALKRTLFLCGRILLVKAVALDLCQIGAQKVRIAST